MCVYCMVMDDYTKKWTPLVPQTPVAPIPWIPTPWPNTYPPQSQPTTPLEPLISQEELAEFRRLLEKARLQDITENNQDCGTEEKKKKIKALAEKLGVDVSFVDEDAK